MIIAISKDDPWWERTRAFAKDCPWQPGRRLAERMSKNDFLDWEKVFVAVHGEDVVGFCVLEENGNIPAKFSCSPFINLVYVGEEFRGERLSKSLIDAALDYAQRQKSLSQKRAPRPIRKIRVQEDCRFRTNGRACKPTV